MRYVPLSLVLLSTSALPAQGKLELAAPFADHMVLQRNVTVPVWGFANAGAGVTVSIAGKLKTAVAGAKGKWMVKLDPMRAGGPHELVVTGEKKIRITDVLVGEVWLCSGQSNMAWTVRSSSNFQKERLNAQYPKIRMFTVARAAKSAPETQCTGQWKLCNKENVGAFSAAAYFFGRKLHKSLKVPVGLINSSWGGTAIEAWTSVDVQRGVAKLEPVFAPWDKQKKAWDPKKAEQRHKKQLAQWKKRAEKARAEGKRVPRRPGKPRDPALNQNHPANLYNGMIVPLIPFAIRGAIWYQGERNARNNATATLYRHQLPLMITDWRQRWGQGEFPFLWAQLPNFKKRTNEPGVTTAWALMRESMLQSLKVPNTGMAVTIDIGMANNIHPKNKQDVGLRLAHWALAKTYGENVVVSGPIYETHLVDGPQVVISFRYSDGVVKARDGELKGFAIAGADKQWRWAKAVAKNGNVFVSHPDVKEPVAVRYAWGDNPDCNLVNGAGLPASPFRTDTWND